MEQVKGHHKLTTEGRRMLDKHQFTIEMKFWITYYSSLRDRWLFNRDDVKYRFECTSTTVTVCFELCLLYLGFRQIHIVLLRFLSLRENDTCLFKRVQFDIGLLTRSRSYFHCRFITA